MTSILTGTKKLLGIAEDYTHFDDDIIMHINTSLAILNQLGIGPEDGFEIEDDTKEWSEFVGTDPRLSSVRTYVYLKVKSLFDPPSTGYFVESLNKQLTELEWRLNTFREVEVHGANS